MLVTIGLAMKVADFYLLIFFFKQMWTPHLGQRWIHSL